MAALPTDQTRQFDYPPGRGRTVADALAAPPASMVSAATRGDTLSKAGNPTGTGPGTNTARPAAGSVYISGGTKQDGTVVAAGTNPAPLQAAHRDAYKTQNDTASVQGPGAPVGVTAGTLTATTAPLSWTAPAGQAFPPTGYRSQKSVKSGAVWGAWADTTVQPSGTTAAVTETGLTSGSNVRFRVFTKSGSRESTASNVVTVTLP